MKTKLTLFVAVLFANCLLAVELPDGVSKDSKDPLVQAFIKNGGDIVAALHKINPGKPNGKCDSSGKLVTVYLNGNNDISDDAIVLLSAVPSLKWISLKGTKITNRAMTYIAKCPNLEQVAIMDTIISNDGLKRLKDLKHLSYIQAYHCQGINDDIFPALLEFKAIRNIDFRGSTRVTKKGIETFKKLRPMVKISH